MRVIAGAAGGLRLEVPARGVRPTMDRVKAAVFSSLGTRVIEARVLDLFAGSGALGIEALSRGARSVLFVEQDRAAVRAIERNLQIAQVNGQVRPGDVWTFLRSAQGSWDIVFADPPYEPAPGGESFTDLLLTHEMLPGLLASGGLFVLEKRPEEKLVELQHWELARARRYGATEVLFLRARSDAPR